MRGTWGTHFVSLIKMIGPAVVLPRSALRSSFCYPTHRAIKLRDGWGDGRIGGRSYPGPKSEGPGAPFPMSTKMRGTQFFVEDGVHGLGGELVGSEIAFGWIKKLTVNSVHYVTLVELWTGRRSGENFRGSKVPIKAYYVFGTVLETSGGYEQTRCGRACERRALCGAATDS